jgi:TonB family protein
VNYQRVVLLFSVFFSLSGAFYASPQDIDAFYLKALEKGEKAFLSRDYPQAAKEFEVAAFGLAGNSELKAKALSYLGLTRFYLNDIKACEKNLREAAGLLKEGDWSGLEIAPEARPDLERLLGYLNLTSANQEGSPPEAGMPLKADTTAPAVADDNISRKIPEQDQEPNLNVDLLKEGDLVPLELAETPPEVTKKVAAIYPDWARTSGLEPTVTVGALISETGKVIRTRIIEGAKNAAGFNQAAEQAVRLWKFRPATIKGLRVKVWLPVSVRFRVRSED